MSDAEKVTVLKDKLEQIREATYAEFQIELEDGEIFNPRIHVCPLCRRASTAKHMRRHWALIQSLAAEGIRQVEESEDNHNEQNRGSQETTGSRQEGSPLG